VEVEVKKEIKKEKLSTIEVQELLFKKYLEDYKMRHGKTFEELISMANDPRKFGKVGKKNETKP
jgi:hypothetical protein